MSYAMSVWDATFLKESTLNNVVVDSPQTAARAALSRIVLARDSGYQHADREDILQDATLKAALAERRFLDLGLEPTATGMAGYMVLAARRAALDTIGKLARRRANEAFVEFDAAAPVATHTSYHGVEKRAVVTAVLAEVDDVIGGEHATVARLLLDPTSMAHIGGRPVRAIAAHLRRTVGQVNAVVDQLTEYFMTRSPQYVGA